MSSAVNYLKHTMGGHWLLLLLLACTAAHHTHNCIHDQVIHKQKLIAINDTATVGRRLQGNEYGPIRFYLIYNTTQINSTTTTGQNIIKMMDILTLFWKKTIDTYYSPTLSFNVAAGFDPGFVQCLSFTVPQDVIKNGVPNADYGMLVQAVNDGDTGVTAYSYPCAYSVTTKAPMWGLLHWNLNYYSFDLLSFQMNIKIGIHESTHNLGFSSILYDNYLYGKRIVNDQGNFLNGSYLQKAIKDQYGCTSAAGMPLETGGGQGTALSHWAYKVAYNEYMTAGVLMDNPTISYLTLALLEETGWYKSISKRYGQFINWGYQKGCSVLKVKDCSSNEYCSVESVKKCNYDQTALGYCKNESLTNCLFVKFYTNFICSDPNYATKSLNGKIIDTTGEEGGEFSRCFDSDLITQGSPKSKYPFRCYTTLCSPSGKTLTIKIGNRYALCMFPGQNITISGYDGSLTCPTSFSRVCAIKRCPQACNANGVCLNGKCLCSSSYTGESCSQVTSVGFASRQVQTIFFAQSNDNCVFGSYRSEFGECEPCGQRCASCDSSGCKICIDQSLPDEMGQCN